MTAAEAARTRLDWQYLLGLPLDDLVVSTFIAAGSAITIAVDDTLFHRYGVMRHAGMGIAGPGYRCPGLGGGWGMGPVAWGHGVRLYPSRPAAVDRSGVGEEFLFVGWGQAAL